jgi:hypothetical protein
MTLTAGSLADGQLTDVDTLLYQTPVLHRTVANQLVCYNGHSAVVQVTLWLKRAGGTARILAKPTLAAGDVLIYGPIELSEGDGIRGLASVTLKIDYSMTGYEEAMD